MALLRAAHPGPSLVVTAVTAALAVGVGYGWRALWIALAVLAGQASIGWGNDWLDAASDRAAGRHDKPVAAGAVPVRRVRAAALAALAAAVPLSAAFGWRGGVVHLAGVGAGWAYDLGLKRTVWSGAVYLVGFGLVPVAVWLGAPGRGLPPGWVVGGAALLGLGGHFLQTLTDHTVDARVGVRGLPQRLGPGRSLAAGCVALAAALALLVVGRPGGVSVAAGGVGVVALAGVAVAGAVGRPRLAFWLAVVVAGAGVAGLVASPA